MENGSRWTKYREVVVELKKDYEKLYNIENKK